MAGFYSARGWTIPPLPWPTFAPPLSVKPDRIRKSIGAEDTFGEDLHDLEAARAGLKPLVDKVWRYCEANSICGKTVTLKVK